MEAGALTTRGDRSILARSPLSGLPDRALKWGLTALAAGILILIGFFFVRLYIEARPAFHRFGVLGFTFDNDWNVSRGVFGALPLLVGTLITSAVALVIGVPVAVATALYTTELCPRRLRAPLTITIDLLAAVPSIVYGLWGVFVLVPKIRPAEQWFSDTFSFLPFVGGNVPGPNYFIAGLILAIMILPIVTAITREVMATVPPDHKEAALALGATRWEMIRTAILPYSRAGIAGASMLGLGRAIGETIAVTLVIGNAPAVPHAIFDQGYTLAAVIANEFGEAANNPLHVGALVLAPVSARRRRADRLARGALLALTAVALVPLLLIVYLLLKNGLGALSWSFFSTDPTGSFLGNPGGIKSAILGTIEIVALATLIAVPVGVLVALYLVEYGRASAFGKVVRYLVDVLTGVPSIVFGLFVYIVLVTSSLFGTGYAAWKGSVALALLMLPVVVRSSEVVLLLVPDSR